MKILIDTHILLWWLSANTKLSKNARKIIADSNNKIFVSVASIWEILIKKSNGKLEADYDFYEELEYYNFTPLDINIDHALAVEHLPKHHADPFDRIMIAQARVDNLRFITYDKNIAKYNVNIVN